MTNDQLDTSSQRPLPAEKIQDLEETPTETSNDTSFPIVGIGASAGGLEAFTQLLKALPCDTGIAFVLVQHLAPTHASALAEILSRATKMPVTEVQDEPTVEPNHVYVIPPARSMIVAGDTLQLLPREGTGMHRPIDQFFRSLAEEWRHRAIGVVLSGTATDGTLGLEAIKAEGGITFAQDATAQHEGMPHSAIASGCVDFVLPPDEIAREIVRIGQHPYVVPKMNVRATDDKPIFAQILELLHQTTGVDFIHYKFNTLYRRITRRMVLQKLNDLSQYVEFLRKTPAEVEALYQDILISVTSFFRDPESFEALQSVVFPRLLKGRTCHDPVRIWTLGCSTGQEAYSLAIAYLEAAEAIGSQAPLQVFATDLNVANIEKARAGVYPKEIAQDVSPERLRRFFSEVDTGYRISKTVRDACVFSQHNVLADPPFSRIDVISCRNLLIYMEPVLQQKIVPLLHYALKSAGCLWLGGSETIGSFRNLFESEDSGHKIYTRKLGSNTDRGHFALQHSGAPRAPFVPFSARPVDAAVDLHKEADRILLTKFAPPGVVVSANLEILQYRGDTGPFLTPAPGKASLSLLKMLREGLLVGVRAAILQAGKEESPVRDEGLRVKSNGSYHEVAIEVIPVGSGEGRVTSGEKRSGGFLVLFEDKSGEQKSGERRVTSDGQENSASVTTHHSSLTTQLEQELAATRDYLQSLIEEQEAANEELQSANEEVQSANEELQSTNEELETSKEEIQSSNEELATVNDELNNRNAELNRVNNDLVNLVASIQSAVVMLGPDLRVRRFTPSAEALLNLIPGDVGRPLADIKLNLDGLPDFESLLKAVLDTADPRECEVRDRQGRWYSLRLRPYRTVDKVIDGVVVMLVDVDAMKRAHEYTESIVATVREPLLVLDKDLRVQSASRSFYETFQAAPEDTIGRPLFELGNGQWDIPDLRRLLVEVLPLENDVADFEMEHEFERIGRKSMRLNARRLIQAADQAPLILLAIEDITERRQVEDQLTKNDERLRAIMDTIPQKIFTARPDGHMDYFNSQWTEFTGMSMEEMHDSGWTHYVHPDDLARKTRIWQDAFETGVPFQSEHRFRRADGEYRWHFSRATPLRDETGRILMWVGSNTDVHDIKQAEVALHDSEVRYRRLFEAAKDGVLILDSTDGRIIDVNPFMQELLGYSNDEFLGKELWEIGLFSDKVANESALRGLQQKGYLRFEHLPLKSKDGGSVEVEVVANAYQEDHHSVIQCNIRDITERSRMETVLRRQAVQLSELHRRKDEFLAMLSHELRSPLAPIANAVQLLGLQRAGESRIQQQARGIIERQVGQLQHLVDDLLEVSRITTGRVQLRLERVDICRVAEGAVETVRPLIEQRRHELTVSLPQEPVWMVADAARLEQVLVNLLTNASKYTEGGGHIWLTVDVVASDEWRVARENSDEWRVTSGDEKSGEWRVAGGEKEKSGEWRVAGGEKEKSGEWRVASGEKEKSGEWRVASGEKEKAVGDILPVPDLTTHHSSLTTHHPPLTTSAFSHDRATLPGTQGLAGSDELGRALLPGDEKFPQGGTVRINQPDSPSGSVGASQHRGGARTPAHEGIPEFSERGERIADGGGNTLAAESASGPAQSNNAGFASNDVGGNQSDAFGPSTRAGEKSGEWRGTGKKSGEWRVTGKSGEWRVTSDEKVESRTDLTTHHSPLATPDLATPCVVIRVRDTGVGIPPALLPHIFDLFTQADRSLDRSQGGLGIGLALVQRLTELHGGHVEAFSTVGEGSEFAVRLPVTSEEWRVTSGESQNSSSLTTHHSPLATPLRVLVVDDNVDTVLGFSMLLTSAGHDVRTAHDGLSAVEAAIDYRPDVVLLDIGLPGLNGYEVAKRIRLQPALRNIVLIALTGYGQDTDRQASHQAGFNHHLVKPARFEQLKKILTTVQEGLKV